MIDRTPIPNAVHPSFAARSRGCRCEPCLRLKRRSDKLRKIYGNTLAEAEPIQQLVNTWLAEGFSSRAIAGAVGMSPIAVRDLAHRRRVWKKTAAKFMGLTRIDIIMAAPDVTLVPIVGSARRLKALIAMGHTYAGMAANSREYFIFRAITQGEIRCTSAAYARRIIDLYNQKAMTPGKNLGNRTIAKAAGTAPPLAWDDDAIDDPDATPDFGAPEPTAAERDATMRALYEQGMNDAQIGEAVNRSRDTVRHWRNRRGLPAIDVTAANLGEERDDRLALWQQGLTDREIADRIGRHPDVVRRWRSRHGLESRTERKRKEAA